jgi:DNA-binding NarL/FixJ family response regulator
MSSSTPPAIEIDELVQLANRGRGVREFSLGAAKILAGLVLFDGVSVLTMDPATSIATSAFVQNGLRAEAALRITEIEYGEGDVNTFDALARSGRIAASLSETTGGDLDRSRRHRELRAPTGLGDELRAVLMSEGTVWGGLTLGRASGREPFTTAEVALVASLSRHLAEGLRRAVLLTGPAAERHDHDEPAGVAVLAADNSIAMADSTAESWLAELGATGPDAPLPPVVTAVASRARSCAQGRGPSGALARARVRTPSATWLTVRGSALGDKEAQTAVTLEPTRPHELAPLIADAYELTSRERAVTQLVAQGLPTDAIAGCLYISRWTVQDHLKAIFEKVGARSRGELTARIFFDHHALRLTDAPEADDSLVAQCAAAGGDDRHRHAADPIRSGEDSAVAHLLERRGPP